MSAASDTNPLTQKATMTDTPTLLTIKLKLHGTTYETRHDADAVLAADWATDTKGIIRHGEVDARDAAQLDREANLGEAKRLANAAASSVLSAKRPDLKPWEARALNAKLALRFIRKVR